MCGRNDTGVSFDTCQPPGKLPCPSPFERAPAITARYMLANGAFHRELPPSASPHHNHSPAVSRLEALGYAVTQKPLADTAQHRQDACQAVPSVLTNPGSP